MKSTATSVAAIILAGGYGTRVRHLHPELPKPLIPVAGRPWLDWVLLWLRDEGVQHAVLATGYQGGQIQDRYHTNPIPGLRTTVSHEQEPLGTAGALAQAAATVEDVEILVVANGDSLVLVDLAACLRDFVASGLHVALAAVPVEDCSRFGRVEVDSSGRLQGFREKGTGSGLINAGIYFFRRKTIGGFPSHRPLSLEYELIPDLISKTGIQVLSCDAPFLDIGTPGSLLCAAEFIEHCVLNRGHHDHH